LRPLDLQGGVDCRAALKETDRNRIAADREMKQRLLSALLEMTGKRPDRHTAHRTSVARGGFRRYNSHRMLRWVMIMPKSISG
jgi:hypothetical protein